MKKLLILLFSILISFNSYGEVELDFSSDTFCDQSPRIQVRDGLFYLPNQEKPYSGNNLCVYLLNGQYHSQGQIKNGLRHGIWHFWFENGQKKEERNYKYNSNFQLTNLQNFKNAILVSETRYEYHWNGQKYKEVNYKDGKKISETLWFDNAQKAWEFTVKDGNLDGKWTRWNKNGQIIGIENYKDGKQDGKQTVWHENGSIQMEVNYKDGKKISRIHYSYYKSGNIKGEVNYKYIGESDILDGTFTAWFENGQISFVENYKDDELDGKRTSWNKNGQIESERTFKNGKCVSGDC